MGHLQQFESELRSRLATGDTETLVKWVKDQVLQSYRNGLKTRRAAGQEGEQAGRSAGRQ